MTGKKISQEVADALLDISAYIFAMQYIEKNQAVPDDDMVIAYSNEWFCDYCKFMGIEEVLVDD